MVHAGGPSGWQWNPLADAVNAGGHGANVRGGMGDGSTCPAGRQELGTGQVALLITAEVRKKLPFPQEDVSPKRLSTSPPLYSIQKGALSHIVTSFTLFQTTSL